MTARRWHLLTALCAWLGLAVSLSLSVTAAYPSTVTVASRYGYAAPTGLDGLGQRLADWISYFTIWSNLAVAVVATVLVRGVARPGPVVRAGRLASVLMITVTALVYAIVLAPAAVQRGWENLSNTLLHQVTPLVAITAWVVAGPRGWVRWSTTGGALALPALWVAWMLARGAATATYPYPFVDVAALGVGRVLANLAGVLGLGLALAAALLALDRWLGPRATRRRERGVDG